ncbi:MAG: methyltransferase domain-containing protein [Bradymonadaceae bacterium]
MGHLFEAGVDVELVEGDAQALPFDDSSFDAALTTCVYGLGHLIYAGCLDWKMAAILQEDELFGGGDTVEEEPTRLHG